MNSRFYAESDGDAHNRSHYVVDRYADPLSDQKRTDCQSHKIAVTLAQQWNERPPWRAWDTIQEARDRQ